MSSKNEHGALGAELQTDWQSLETPCFVIDEPEFRLNLSSFARAIQQQWSVNAKVAYSVKTNPFPQLLDIAREESCLAEVVSADEYDWAMRRGYTAPEIVFNGPAKTRDWFEYALAHGSMVNIDSHRELRWACEYAVDHDDVCVGIRVKVELNKMLEAESESHAEGGRFGFSWENGDVAQAIELLKKHGVRVVGLHMHMTNMSQSADVYATLANCATRIVEEHKLDLRWIDMGGGFYGGGKNRGKYDEYATAMAEQLKTHINPESCMLVVEPGGSVIATPVHYVGKVVDIKNTRTGRFVVTELSRVHLNHWIPEIHNPMHVLRHSYEKRDGIDHQTIVGSTCMELDRLRTVMNEPEILEGDTIVLDTAGAYTMGFVPEFFIYHAPSVYMRDAQGNCKLVKAKETPTIPFS